MTLTKEEMETTINWDESSPDADVLTYNRSLQRRMKEIGIEPYLNNGYGGKLYTIPKKLISIRKPRKLTVEQRQKLGARLRESRKQKSPNPSKNNVITKDSKKKVSNSMPPTGKKKGG